MSEEERAVPDKRFVFLDLETTGLDPDKLTVVEASWVITDSDLFQKTPAKSRFTGFSSHPTYGIVLPNSNGWDSLPSAVLAMHSSSGLTEEWLSCPASRLLSSIGELDRLILDDLFASGWDGVSKFTLAGAGLAAFDRSILRVSRSQLHTLSHYRSADSSVACEILGLPVPKSMEAAKSFTDGWLSSEDNFVLGEGCTLPNWQTSKMHRSVVDVSVSVLISRALRKRLRTSPER